LTSFAWCPLAAWCPKRALGSRGLLGNKSSVRQRSASSSPPRRRKSAFVAAHLSTRICRRDFVCALLSSRCCRRAIILRVYVYEPFGICPSNILLLSILTLRYLKLTLFLCFIIQSYLSCQILKSHFYCYSSLLILILIALFL